MLLQKKKEGAIESKESISEDTDSKEGQVVEIKEPSGSPKNLTQQQDIPDSAPKTKKEGDEVSSDSKIAQKKLGDQDKVSDVATDISELQKKPEVADMPDLPEPELVLVEEGADADNNKKPAGNPEAVEETKPEITENQKNCLFSLVGPWALFTRFGLTTQWQTENSMYCWKRTGISF